jgi:hypothetical protein
MALQRQMRPGQECLKLKNDVVTRWNSTFYMISRLCQIQEPVEAAVALLHNPVTPLTSHDWEALKEITVVLQPFEAVTNEISGERSVTVSKVIMLSRGLTTACLKIHSSLTNDKSKVLSKNVLEGLQKRFGGSESNTLLA